MDPSVQLPGRDSLLAELGEAEANEGWMSRCVEHGVYQSLSLELVETLAAVMGAIGGQGAAWLEVCAGSGALASALRSAGLGVVATDVNAPEHAVDVAALSAVEALALHRPRGVLAAFVPDDAGVDTAVFRNPAVTNYVVLGAHLQQSYAFSRDRLRHSWTMAPLTGVARAMITRHDAWLGDHRPLQHRGEAWWFRRTTTAADRVAPHGTLA